MNKLIKELIYRQTKINSNEWVDNDTLELASQFMFYIKDNYKSLYDNTWICKLDEDHYVNGIDLDKYSVIIDLSWPKTSISNYGVYVLTDEDLIKESGKNKAEMNVTDEDIINEDIYEGIVELFEGIDLSSL